MGGYDDHVAIIGEWMPPSPSPRAFFSSLMCDDGGSRSIPEPTIGNKSGPHFSGSEQQITLVNADQNDGAQIGIVGNQTSKCNALSEQKMSSRGGLLERMAARAGFNAPRLNTESIKAPDLTQDQEVRSPYFTIPPGLSPTTLLDSPVFLSNSLVQPSPTTGKFPFGPSGNGRKPTLSVDSPDKSKDDFFENINTSSFTFNPVKESTPSLFMGAASRSTLSGLPQQAIPNIEVSVQPENSRLPQSVEASELPSQHGTIIHQQADFSRSSIEKDNGCSAGNGMEQSPPLDVRQDEDADQRGSADLNVGCGPAEDGYNWRKYGQKQVKGSEYPRSYYKCTHPNCPVKKKVERSQEGYITEIIYKGAHNHPKPPPNRRSTFGSLSALGEMQPDSAEQAGTGGDGVPAWTTVQKLIGAGAPDWRNENFEVTSSAQLGSEYDNGPTSLQRQDGTQFESGDALDGSTFSNDEDEDDHGTGSVSLGYDGEGDESESKKRKLETYATEVSGATRGIREPRVVVQTTSEVDILDDGYRWRKYGQKVVKGNPNPRSYYKCTSAGCSVRKHVERASHDLKSVITTYEGKHNHDVPAARNSSHVNSGASNTSIQATSVQSHIHRPEPSHIHNSMAQFERPPSLASFSLPRRPQVGPTLGFGFGMSKQGLANFAMADSGPSQGKSPVHPCMGQPRPVNDMGFMLPKGEPEVEQGYADSGLNTFSGSSIYHQIMSSLPLGPQM